MIQTLRVNVVLPNGHAEALTLLPSSIVQDVNTMAQGALGKKHIRLITAKNRLLVDPEKTLEEAEIEDGECVTGTSTTTGRRRKHNRYLGRSTLRR